jgi:primosomal protein N' (replication factor Y)
VKDAPEVPRVRPLKKVVSQEELVTPELFAIARWMAGYYCCSLQKILKVVLPASVRKDTKEKQQLYVMRAKTREALQEICKEIRNRYSQQAAVLDVMLGVTKGVLLSELLEETGGSRSPVDSLVKKGLLKVDIVRVNRCPLGDVEYFRTTPKELMPEQKIALDAINGSLTKEEYATYLLYGVTGSGKTEVYLQAIEQALLQDKGTIVLVPEIALTIQTIERFRSRFEEKIAVLHHRLSRGERFDEWMRIRRGEARIVIGPRSAVFSPVHRLGLIIVDEEHDSSYKASEEAPCYHARDIAIMRAHLEGAVAVLGSATPALESRHNAAIGKYKLLTLRERPGGSAIPTVTVVDMNREYERNSGYTNFSDPLLKGIQQRVELGEQSLLFLNRRGYHTTLTCKACGEAVQCAHCSVSLTFHRNHNQLSCHLCGYTAAPPPKQCPSCHCGETMKFRGVGTEQIERALHAVLPEVRTLRIDADTTRHKGSHQKLIGDFRAGKADVLIGTQMVAKGLHFPQVTLVGVLNADQNLQIPDFRSAERTFQMVTQVSGRAGRAQLPGEVVLQTRMPTCSTIQHAANQDYDSFYEEECESRKLFGYPPFSHMAKFRFSGEDEVRTMQIGEQFCTLLARHLQGKFQIHPLLPAGHAKIKDRYYFQCMVQGKDMRSLSKAFELTLQAIPIPRGIRILPDIDAQSTF